MDIEKRKNPRFSPQGNAFAALGSLYTRVGRIKDISQGGLAFEYISTASTDIDDSQINIFLIGDVFHIYNIPCALVYDIPQPARYKNVESIEFSTTKRCGVQFGSLTSDDQAQLKFFLESHTKSSV